MNKVQMMLIRKMNSPNYNPKNVKCFSTTATACVFALTFGVGVMLNILTVGAAGQVIGGYTAGNQALGDGSVVVSGGKDKAPNLAEGENSISPWGNKKYDRRPLYRYCRGLSKYCSRRN